MRLRMSNTPSGIQLFLDPELADTAGLFVGGHVSLMVVPSDRSIRLRLVSPHEAIKEQSGHRRADGKKPGPLTKFRTVSKHPRFGATYPGWLAVILVNLAEAPCVTNGHLLPQMTMTEFDVIAAADREVLAQWPTKLAPPRQMGTSRYVQDSGVGRTVELDMERDSLRAGEDGSHPES